MFWKPRPAAPSAPLPHPPHKCFVYKWGWMVLCHGLQLHRPFFIIGAAYSDPSCIVPSHADLSIQVSSTLCWVMLTSASRFPVALVASAAVQWLAGRSQSPCHASLTISTYMFSQGWILPKIRWKIVQGGIFWRGHQLTPPPPNKNDPGPTHQPPPGFHCS